MIRVGISTRHGMADEVCAFPPDGVEFSFPDALPVKNRLVQSPLKCFLMHIESKDLDVIEAVLSPILTKNTWICSLDSYQAALAYNFLGLPLPKIIRRAYINGLFRKPNCRKVIFWSQAAFDTMTGYGGVRDPEMIAKSTVVYPAIRRIDATPRINRTDRIQFLFSGDFFRKGGASVIDSFLVLVKEFPNITMKVCCDEQIDFRTKNEALRTEYLNKIRSCNKIEFGRISRSEMISKVVPESDVYLLPTYIETFGFGILEAMAYGIPVISTNHFAIPEIIESGKSGFLIDNEKHYDMRAFRGYKVDYLPEELHRSTTDQLTHYMRELIVSPELRLQIGLAGQEVARSKFSFEERNRKMLEIYQECVEYNQSLKRR